ncbi:hypothetical protein DFH29DRAFT_988065 [Suillus ampliporus]|nr:hypothetical protein DFH29DRAFT_988065 [Suillus ampliporus]
MTHGAVGGVSRKCVVQVGGKKTTLRARGIRQQEQDAHELWSALLKKIPLQERECLLQSELASKAIVSNDIDFRMDLDAVLPPPGEEAHALSHAGEEMLLYQELDQLMNDPQNIHAEAKKLCHLHNVSHCFLNHYYIFIYSSDEVQSACTHQAKDNNWQHIQDPNDPWVDELDSTDAEPSNVCVDCWHNAVLESCKKMFAIFKKSGIFITVCWHGFLLIICDMKLMDVFGLNILYGYNIKCTFEKILLRSSLADDVKRLNIQGIVPTFHGHAHNRLCQLPTIQTAQMHNSTEFYCHQALDEHFCFANMDKYAGLSDLEDEHACLQALACKKDETSVEVDYKLEIVEDYEWQMALETHWHPDHPERLKAQSRIMHWLYHKAVSDVEHFVVMRLLELMKMQMNGIGCKLHTQISSTLKMCATAIRNAIQRYNKYSGSKKCPNVSAFSSN